MTSAQVAESSRFGATLAIASDAKAHRQTFVAAIERTQALRAEYEAQQARSARHSALLASVERAFCAA
jgi:hypothetical protein